VGVYMFECNVPMLLLVHIGPNGDLHEVQLRTKENIRTPKYSIAGGEKQRAPRDKSACAAPVHPVAAGQPHDHPAMNNHFRCMPCQRE